MSTNKFPPGYIPLTSHSFGLGEAQPTHRSGRSANGSGAEQDYGNESPRGRRDYDPRRRRRNGSGGTKRRPPRRD